MEAPDKIYLSVVTSMLTRQQYLYPEWQYSPLKFANDNIEYICKDNLIEWLNGVKLDPMIPMNIDKVIDYIKAL